MELKWEILDLVKMLNKKTMSIMQVMVLVVGVFAIAWAVGGGVGFVSAAGCTINGMIHNEGTIDVKVCIDNKVTKYNNCDDGTALGPDELTQDCESKTCVQKSLYDAECMDDNTKTSFLEGLVGCESGSCGKVPLEGACKDAKNQVIPYQTYKCEDGKCHKDIIEPEITACANGCDTSTGVGKCNGVEEPPEEPLSGIKDLISKNLNKIDSACESKSPFQHFDGNTYVGSCNKVTINVVNKDGKTIVENSEFGIQDWVTNNPNYGGCTETGYRLIYGHCNDAVGRSADGSGDTSICCAKEVAKESIETEVKTENQCGPTSKKGDKCNFNGQNGVCPGGELPCVQCIGGTNIGCAAPNICKKDNTCKSPDGSPVNTGTPSPTAFASTSLKILSRLFGVKCDATKELAKWEKNPKNAEALKENKIPPFCEAQGKWDPSKTAGIWGALIAGGGMVTGALGAPAGISSGIAVAGAGATGLGVILGQLTGSVGLAAGTTIFGSAILFALNYQGTKTKKYIFTSKTWKAPFGSDRCEECNSELFGCTEYQCKSLGQNCELENAGTGEEVCVGINRNDANYPTMIPRIDSLLNEDYEYNPDDAILTPDYGVSINYDGDKVDASQLPCVPAFTPISFGLELNEPGQCKIDSLRKDNFSDMAFDFGGSSLFKYNHTQVMSLPGPSAETSGELTIENDGQFEFFVKCIDVNQNENVGSFIFKYCVDQGPDTTPPLIISTDPLSGLPIAHNISALDVTLYINEPGVDCRWDINDQDYDEMSEVQQCSTGTLDKINAQMAYPCEFTEESIINGLNDDVENKFYFRCIDGEGNKNVESYEYLLKGTAPLVIQASGPNGTISDSTYNVKITLEAKTFAGFDEGKSNCYFKPASAAEQEFTLFFTDSEYDTYEHSQDLALPQLPIGQKYNYEIKCVDLGGNEDRTNVIFDVYSDYDSPILTRVYNEENYLKLITNEPAECVYDTFNCDYIFDDGIKMNKIDEINHYTDWNINSNYYVKCKDDFGNRPNPNACTIVVRPFEIVDEEVL